MAYEKRQDKEPSAAFFAQVEATWKRTWPEAKIDRATMERLKPALVAAWRRGYSAKTAATSTCSCDGNKIDPSPTLEVSIPKGAVRPPKGAGRGAIFGADELRPPPAAERRLREIDIQKEAIERQEVLLEEYKARGKTEKAQQTAEKLKGLKGVLKDLEKRLAEEWPEGQRFAPAVAPPRKKKTPKPKKERPAKTPKPKKEKPAKTPRPKKERPAKTPKPKKERPAKTPKPKKANMENKPKSEAESKEKAATASRKKTAAEPKKATPTPEEAEARAAQLLKNALGL